MESTHVRIYYSTLKELMQLFPPQKAEKMPHYFERLKDYLRGLRK